MRTRRTFWLIIGIVMLVLIACQPEKGNTETVLGTTIEARA